MPVVKKKKKRNFINQPNVFFVCSFEESAINSSQKKLIKNMKIEKGYIKKAY